MHMAVRDDGVATVNRCCTGEIAEAPASLLDQDLERCNVPGFDIRLQHHLSLAATHERIGKIITKPALPASGLHQTSQPVPMPVPQHQVETAVQQCRLSQ